METKKLKDLSFEAICGIIAKVVHSANRAYVDAIGGRAVNLTWEEIREEERQSLSKAISSMIINPQTPSISHEQWCLAREEAGWSKDLKYDYNRKTHPNMLPYDQLPFEEQFKDHLCMGIASIFYGALALENTDDVKAARKLLAPQYAPIEDPNEDVRIDVEDEIDLVDPATTEALQEKLKIAQAELDRLEAEQNAKDEDKDKPEADQGPDHVIINGVDHIYRPVMDDENKETPVPSDEEILANREAAEVDPLASVKTYPGEQPLPPTAAEILANKPKDYTAKDLAKDVLGAANVGEVPEGQGPKSDLPGKTIGPPKPNLPAKPKKKKKAAVKK